VMQPVYVVNVVQSTAVNINTTPATSIDVNIIKNKSSVEEYNVEPVKVNEIKRTSVKPTKAE
jgi:hypothetical protein